MKKLVLLITILSLTAGCQTMALKDLNQDIPENLVKTYKTSHQHYADEGSVWVPFIAADSGKVSKTKDGFSAGRAMTLGPLGLPIATGQRATYDTNGRQLSYASNTGFLWGIFMSLGDTKAQTNKGWKSGSNFDVLFGLIGNKTELNGEKTFYFLWIPIPIADGDDSIEVHEPPEEKPSDPKPKEEA